MNTRNLALLLAMMLVTFASASCKRAPPAPEPVIVGRVFDNFSRPIQGATASIRDTAFRVQTDAHGNFSLPYTPGAFHIVVESPGCLTWERDLQIAVPVRHPLGNQVLVRLPETAPSVVVVAAIGGYHPLAPVTLERRVVTPAGGGFYNRCAEFHLTAPVATLRGTFLPMFLPNETVGLVALQGTLVTSDPFLTTTTNCPGAPLVPAHRRDMGERQLIALDELPVGTYCFIRLPRGAERGETAEAHCFRWEHATGAPQNPVMTDPPAPVAEITTFQTAEDHAADDGERMPPDCEARSDGKIPCSERCYTAHRRWNNSVDADQFLTEQQAEGQCYGP